MGKFKPGDSVLTTAEFVHPDPKIGDIPVGTALTIKDFVSIGYSSNGWVLTDDNYWVEELSGIYFNEKFLRRQTPADIICERLGVFK